MGVRWSPVGVDMTSTGKGENIHSERRRPFRPSAYWHWVRDTQVSARSAFRNLPACRFTAGRTRNPCEWTACAVAVGLRPSLEVRSVSGCG